MKAPVWTRKHSRERFPKAVTPLGWSILQTPLQKTLDGLAGEFQCRRLKAEYVAIKNEAYVYTRDPLFDGILSLRPGIGATLYLAAITLKAFLRSLFPHFFSSLSEWRNWLKNRKKLPLYGIRWGGTLHVFWSELFVSLWRPRIDRFLKHWPQASERCIADMKRASEDLLKRTSRLENLKAIKREVDESCGEFYDSDFSIYFQKNLLLWHLERQLEVYGHDILKRPMNGAESAALIENLTHPSQNNITALIAREAAAFEGDDAAFSDWMARNYGHLAEDFDISRPLLCEIREWRHLAHGLRRRPAASSLKSSTYTPAPPKGPLCDLWHETIDSLNALIRADEIHRIYCTAVYPGLKKMFLDFGYELVSQNKLENAEDIYFLTLSEQIRQELPALEQIKERKAAFLRAEKITPPENLREDGGGRFTAVEPPPSAERSRQRAIGVSPGKVQGRLRRIFSPENMVHLGKADIAVIETPHPLYIFLFDRIGGLVCLSGGRLSHAAIAAREKHLPAVFNAQSVDIPWRDGDHIAIDGTYGTVELLEENHAQG